MPLREQQVCEPAPTRRAALGSGFGAELGTASTASLPGRLQLSTPRDAPHEFPLGTASTDQAVLAGGGRTAGRIFIPVPANRPAVPFPGPRRVRRRHRD